MKSNQFRQELFLDLSEQGFDWYRGEYNLMGLALIGIMEIHKDKIVKLAEKLSNAKSKRR